MCCEKASPDTNLTKESDLMPLVYFRLTTDDEVYHMLSKSAPEARGLSLVPNLLVKDHVDVLAPTITAVVNLSMQDGLFPSCLKNA